MLRKILEKLSAALSGLTVGLLMASMAAFALTVPPTFGPRNFQTQQVGYYRIYFQNAANGGLLVNGTLGCVLGVPSAGICIVRVGALPPNAAVLRIFMQVSTAFNSATTDTIGLGVSTATFTTSPFLPSAAVNLMALVTIHATAAAAQTVAAGGIGSQLTNNAQNQFGVNGGQDLYLEYSQTGAVATAGAGFLVVEYIAPNDGACTDTPLGGTLANGLFLNC